MNTDIISLDGNGNVNSLSEDRVMHYVARYRNFARNTAESILGLGKTVAEAADTLTGEELNTFCEQVGIEPNGATYRKLRKIGSQAERLSEHMDSLPNSWTTVYALARMNKDEFSQVVENGALSPTVSMKEITQVLSGEKVKKDTLSITLVVEVTSADQAFQLERAYNEIIAEHGGKLRWSNIEKRNAWLSDLWDQRMAA